MVYVRTVPTLIVACVGAARRSMFRVGAVPTLIVACVGTTRRSMFRVAGVIALHTVVVTRRPAMCHGVMLVLPTMLLVVHRM
jgi:hypothetical protein